MKSLKMQLEEKNDIVLGDVHKFSGPSKGLWEGKFGQQKTEIAKINELLMIEVSFVKKSLSSAVLPSLKNSDMRSPNLWTGPQL